MMVESVIFRRPSCVPRSTLYKLSASIILVVWDCPRFHISSPFRIGFARRQNRWFYRRGTATSQPHRHGSSCDACCSPSPLHSCRHGLRRRTNSGSGRQSTFPRSIPRFRSSRRGSQIARSLNSGKPPCSCQLPSKSCLRKSDNQSHHQTPMCCCVVVFMRVNFGWRSAGTSPVSDQMQSSPPPPIPRCTPSR